MAGKRCGNCDTLNREGAMFCVGCGARLMTAPQPPPPAAPIGAPPTYTPAAPARPVTYRAAPPRPARNYLGVALNILAVACGVGFVVLVCLALPVLNASSRIFNASLYKDALRSQDVYKRFPDLFAEQMEKSKGDLAKSARANLDEFSAADWKLIASELIPPEWLQAQVESLIDQVFAAIQSNATAPTLKISLADVTTRLGGDQGFRVYKGITQNKRECDLFDLLDVYFWMDGDPESYLPICRIPDDTFGFPPELMGYASADALIKDVLKDLPGMLPKEVDLAKYFSLRLVGWGQAVDAIRLAAWAGLALAGLLLLATFISPMGRTLKGWLLLWGIPLAAAGAICLLLALLMPIILGNLISGGITGAIAPGLSKVGSELGKYVARSSATALFLQAAVMLVVGLVMSVGGFVFWGAQRLRAAS